MNTNLQVMAAELTDAVNTIVNPFSTPDKRKKAHEVCENFRNHSPWCVQCGFFLSAKLNPPIIRHFGLQLVEHSVKFRWNDLNPGEKLYIKNNILQMLCTGTEDIVKEQTHIKDVLARIVVEIIKREWPQHWTDMLQEMNGICSRGYTQTELVMLIFLRLAEDLVLFPDLPARRKKEIYQVLTRSLAQLFVFFLKNLVEHSTKYNQLVNSENPGDKEQALVHRKLTETTLMTLAGYVEWVSWDHVRADEDAITVQLCNLLDNKTFRLLAVECLLLIAARKGNVDDRKPVLFLFNGYLMGIMSRIARATPNDILEEEDYTFAKKLCQTLTSLGTQLSSLLSAAPDVTKPDTFMELLSSVFTFSQHPSLWLSSCCLTMWQSFFQHPTLSEDGDVRAVIPAMVKVVTRKLVKENLECMGDPEKTLCRMDFDSEAEYYAFLSAFRSNLVQMLQTMTKLDPVVAFKHGAKTLSILVESYKTCHKKFSYPSFSQQLDALASYMEAVSNRIFSDGKLQLCPEGIELLKVLLTIQTEDVAELSSLMSCMSALFVFLEFDCSILPILLDKLFYASVMPWPSEVSRVDPKTVRDCRRHAASCIVKVCKCYSKILLPAFDQMSALVKEMFNDMGKMITCEKFLILEALILISNEFQDYNKQCAILGEIMNLVIKPWNELRKETVSTEAFLTFVGLREEPLKAEHNEQLMNNRSKVTNCLNFISSVVKRSKLPVEHEVAEKGGFLLKSEDGSTSQMRNPATCHVLPLLDQVFDLVRILNSLHEPSVLSSLQTEYICSIDIPEAEKKSVLGVLYEAPNLPDFCNHLKTMNVFLYFSSDVCLQILGNSALYLGADYYAIPDISSVIKNNILSSLEFIPDYRMKDIIRCFLKPLFLNSPTSSYDLVISVLEVYAPFMVKKLSARWEKYRERYGANANSETEMTETREILDDQLSRMITREYIDLLGCVLKKKKIEGNPDAMEEDVSETKSQSSSLTAETLSPLGIQVIRNEALRATVVYTVFTALQWLDTLSSYRSCSICFAVFNQLLADGLITSNTDASFLLHCALYALSEVGEHEINQSSLIMLCLHVYENLRPAFLCLKSVFLKDFCCPAKDLEKFDSVVIFAKRKCSERKRKEIFRTMVAGVIGKNIGQYYKNEVRIKNLPALFLRTKRKINRVEVDLSVCTLFQEADDLKS